jgi:branched-chain amino acid transport system substrate-binding protein
MAGKNLQSLVLSLCLLTQGCAFFAGAKPAANSGATVKIGFVGSFSGDNAGNGDTVLKAVNMALNQINTVGVLGGRKLQIIQADDKSDPDTGAAVALDLINQGAVALIGPNSSGIAEKIVLKAAVPKGVPMISPSATSPEFSDPTQVDTKGFFFRTVPSDALQGKLIATRAKKLGYTKLAVIHVDNVYGNGLSKVLEQSFGDATKTIDISYPYVADPQKQSTIDFASVVSKALDAKPSGVVLVSYLADGSSVMNEWIRSGRNKGLPWIFTDATDQQAFVDNIKDKSYVEGKFGTAPATDPEFVKRFMALYSNTSPGFDGGAGFDALCLIALAIEEAKSATPSAIRDHLRTVSAPPGETITPDTITQGLLDVRSGKKVNFEGWEGSDDFDEHGDVLTGKYVIWNVKDGKVADTTEIVSP